MDHSIEVTFRVKTQQVIIPEQNIRGNELPLRRWQMELLMLDATGKEVEPTILSKCIYHCTLASNSPKDD